MQTSLKLPPGKFDATGEYVCQSCPKCGEADHFYWNPWKEVGHCFKCKLGVRDRDTFEGLFSGRLSAADLPDRRTRAISELDVPSLWEIYAWDIPVARKFLAGRRVTEEICRLVPIWWIPTEHSLGIGIEAVSPEYPDKILYRRLPDMKWIPREGTRSGHYGFGLRRWEAFPYAEGILLVEGTFDLLSSGMWGWGCALLGTSMPDSWGAWLRSWGCPPALVWFDPDTTGRRDTAKVVERLRAWGVPAWPVYSEAPPKDYAPSRLEPMRDWLNDPHSTSVLITGEEWTHGPGR